MQFSGRLAIDRKDQVTKTQGLALARHKHEVSLLQYQAMKRHGTKPRTEPKTVIARVS